MQCIVSIVQYVSPGRATNYGNLNPKIYEVWASSWLKHVGYTVLEYQLEIVLTF